MCWGRDQRPHVPDNIFEFIFLYEIALLFKLKLHWYLLAMVQLTIWHHWSGQRLGTQDGCQDIKRTNGGIVYWRIKGVTRTRWRNVNKLINIVAFCVGSAIMIVNGVHTLKLTQSITHAVNWSSKSVVGFRFREIPSNSNSWNEINQLFVINQRL